MITEDTLPQVPPPPPRVGEQLRQLRLEQSLTLEEVAISTKVSRANLQAIEEMAYDRLPADSFARGQVILYARFLGMNDRQTADNYFAERDGGKKNQASALQKSLRHQPLTPKTLAEPTHISSATIAGSLFLFIVCSFTAFCLYFSWNPFAYFTGKIFNLSPSTTPLFHPADPATANGGTYHTLKLQAQFRKGCRLLVSLDNKPSLEQNHAKGSTAHWEADKQLIIEFFQPDSAELLLNGTPVPFPAGTDGRYLLRLPATATSP